MPKYEVVVNASDDEREAAEAWLGAHHPRATDPNEAKELMTNYVQQLRYERKILIAELHAHRLHR